MEVRGRGAQTKPSLLGFVEHRRKECGQHVRAIVLSRSTTDFFSKSQQKRTKPASPLIAILITMFNKKPILFAHPETKMLKFYSVLEQIYKQPVTVQKDGLTIKASCMYGQKVVELVVHTHLLQRGKKDAPVVVYLPWYGGQSSQSRSYFDSKRHPDWTHIGIDIFNTKEDFDAVLGSAVVSQYAYALVMRMMAEQVHLVHKAGQRVGIVGLSYGANMLGAYITQHLELPDALVAVEGGSILQTTLKGKYQGRDCDPRTLQALQQEPDLIPVQRPVTGKAATISAAIINLDDKIVIGQKEIWANAATKMHIRGGHLLGPRLYRGKIRRFVDGHFERLLTV